MGAISVVVWDRVIKRFAEWFGSQWAGRAPSTWNVSLDAVRSAAAYWQRHGWLVADFSRLLARRTPRPDRGRALSRAEVDQLHTGKDISLRERTLWRMLYETAARSAEVLALDVEDLDLPNGQAKVRRKGVWVPKTLSPYATWAYSWISPPSRSRRRIRTFTPGAVGCGRPARGPAAVPGAAGACHS
jgi:integrase